MGFVGAEAIKEVREVNFMGIELRTVYAGEFGYSVQQHPAAAAHAGTVDHDRIEAAIGWYGLGTGELGYGSHHRHRAGQ